MADQPTHGDILQAFGKVQGTLEAVQKSVDRIERDNAERLKLIEDRTASLERSRARLWGGVSALPFFSALATWFGLSR